MNTPKPTSSGIRTHADGQAYIPSSKRADGSTRKEIKVRPGYKPPEDVEKYKSRSAETWRSHGNAGIPGIEETVAEVGGAETRSKNAKRREAARKKKEVENEDDVADIESGVADLSVDNGERLFHQTTSQADQDQAADKDSERQKKIRNQLKKLKAIRELKSKRSTGEKLAADQLIKISKEQEIVRDLIKLEYDGPEMDDTTSTKGTDEPE